MKISELIKSLQDYKEKAGDVEIENVEKLREVTKPAKMNEDLLPDDSVKVILRD